MKSLILMAVVFIFVPLVDYLWLNKLMSGFYLSELGSLARAENGKFQPLLAPAAVVYFCIALGIVFFVLPKVDSGSLAQAALWGSLFGFVLYGLYDMTNLSLVQSWPVKMSFADIAWGTFICGLSSTVAQLVLNKLNF